MTQPTVIHMTGRYSVWISKLTRNQKAASQAAPATTTSCRKASAERGLTTGRLTMRRPGESFPAPVDGPHRRHNGQRKRENKRELSCGRLLQTGERCRAAQEHQPVFGHCSTPMTPAGQEQSLVVMLAVCLPDTFAARHPAHEGHAGIDDERREDDQRKPERPE